MPKRRNHSRPTASRPYMPSYGIANADSGKGLLPWSWAVERLVGAHTYWIATTRPNGRPHVMPVWGLWLDDAFYFSTGRNSRKARNLAANAECVVTLDHSGEQVIIEGVAHEATDTLILKQCWEAYNAKYHWDVEGMNEPFFAVRPRVAFGFIENDEAFTTTATRWLFEVD